MKNSAAKLFAKGFFKSLIFFAFLFCICTLSFKMVMHFFDIENETVEVMETVPSIQEQTGITQASIDDISKHLIISVDEETGSINKLVLEIFNCQRNKLTYITIPIKTQLNLSNSLHKKLILIKPSIPQFLMISAITSYIPDDMAYEYTVLMIEELLNINISYYTVVPQSVYETVFVTEKLSSKANSKSNENAMAPYPREIFSPEFLEFLHTIKTETQLREYIKDIYSNIKSNLSFEDKLNYMDSYLNITGKGISFEVISGRDSNSTYIIDEAAADKQLKTFMEE